MTKKKMQELLQKRTRLDVANGLAENVAQGFAEVAGVNGNGETLYRLTPEGIKRAEALIAKAKAELEAERS